MVIYTMTKKQILRIAAIVLGAAVTVFIVVFAVLGSVTASADSEKQPVRSVNRPENRIALTFNCAWDTGDIDTLLEELSGAGIKATFFVTGEFAETHSDAVRKMSMSGHSIQDLTDRNIHIRGININSLIDDTRESRRKIKTVTGKEPVLLRAPFDDFDDKTLTTVEGMGLVPVQWSVDSKDLDDPDPVSVKKRVVEGISSGSVILFHNDSPVCTEALPAIITDLRQKGYEFVRAEELVYLNDYTVDSNGVQQYRPAVKTALPVIYCDYNAALNSAFEKMRVNLTLQQIYDLSSVGRVGLVDEIKSFLNESELYAVREATYEELMDCYLVLVRAAETYGAGGTYAQPQYEPIPQIVSVPEEPEEDIPDIIPVPDTTPKDAAK